jgi:hypothetical protein
MRRDHYVQFLTEERIAATALKWRLLAERTLSWTFDIIEFVECVLPKHLRKGSFTVERFDRKSPKEDPAFVTYDPTVLHVDRMIWARATRRDGFARFVVAHEIGHIILHDSFAKPFSSDPTLNIRFGGMDEYSAEWQANIFARYFLVPDLIVAQFETEEQMVELCDVPDDVARDALATHKEKVRRAQAHAEQEYCIDCGHLAVVRKGTISKCSRCMWAAGE